MKIMKTIINKFSINVLFKKKKINFHIDIKKTVKKIILPGKRLTGISFSRKDLIISLQCGFFR